MPKMKTHRGAAKRYRVTGSGKIRRRKAFRSHLLEKKSSRRTRRLGRGAEVTGGDKKHVERLLGRYLEPRRHTAAHAGGKSTMARVKRSVQGKKHRRAVLEKAAGYSGAKSRGFRKANEQVMRSLRYAYRDRRARKGEFRRLWIVRINAACRQHDISYSRFVAGLKAADIDVDRKILADLAVHDSAAFGALVAVAREALQAA